MTAMNQTVTQPLPVRRPLKRPWADPSGAWLGEVTQAGQAVSPLAVSPRPLVGHGARTLPVYGVLVHTTADGPATKGRLRRQEPIKVALDFYGSGGLGPHYVIGYDGTIYAICSEGNIAYHAGWGKAGKRRWA